jgi:fumarate reductase flavoprotein subunit
MIWSLEHVPLALLRPVMMKFLTTMLAPAKTLFDDGARLVNRRGERFGDERERAAWRLPDQPGKVGWIVIDALIARRYQSWPNFISTAPGIAYAYLEDYRRNRPDVFAEAATLSALAARLGMDADALQASAAANGDRPALGEAPFIALGPVRSVFVHAEGGLCVDERHRVLDAQGAPIAGLLAAGSTGQGGLLLKGHGHHLAWAFASGRRAGRFAAEAAVAARAAATG